MIIHFHCQPLVSLKRQNFEHVFGNSQRYLIKERTLWIWAGSQTAEKGRGRKEEVKRKGMDGGEEFGGCEVLPKCPLVHSARSLWSNTLDLIMIKMSEVWAKTSKAHLSKKELQHRREHDAASQWSYPLSLNKLVKCDPGCMGFNARADVGWGFHKQYKTALRLNVVPRVHIWKPKYPNSYIASVWRWKIQRKDIMRIRQSCENGSLRMGT